MIVYLLVANSLLEAGTGLGMIFAPSKLTTSNDAVVASVARSLGVALITVSVMSAMMVVYGGILPGLIALTVFHIGFAISQAMSFATKLAPLPVVVIHAVLAVLFAIALVHRL